MTLVNSVLDGISTYLMSLTPIPASVEKKIDKIRKKFLWEGDTKRRKYHLVKWSIVTKHKKEGGLGVRNLRAHNQSLLCKWLWRLNDGIKAPWKAVVEVIYGKEGFFAPKKVKTPYGVAVWHN